MALLVDDLDALLERLVANGIERERPPYSPGGRPETGRICLAVGPDGYRIELINRDLPTPKPPAAPLESGWTPLVASRSRGEAWQPS
jgi:hypothetical protein